MFLRNLLLSLILCFSVVACKSRETPEPDEKNSGSNAASSTFRNSHSAANLLLTDLREETASSNHKGEVFVPSQYSLENINNLKISNIVFYDSTQPFEQEPNMQISIESHVPLTAYFLQQEKVVQGMLIINEDSNLSLNTPHSPPCYLEEQ